MSVTSKLGINVKPLLILSAIIVALILINLWQANQRKKDYSEMNLKAAELTQCQATNKESEKAVQEVKTELKRCVGIREQIKTQSEIALIKHENESANRIKSLNERIEALKQMPVHECDNNVVDPDVVRMWTDPADS